MFKQITVITLFSLIIIDSTIGYTCSCNCPSSYFYQGTAQSTSCDTTSCTTVCMSSYPSSCTTWSNTFGTCSTDNSQDAWNTAYSVTLSVAQIIGVVIGCIAGLVTLIIIIVIIFCVCKKKGSRGMIIQAQPPQIPYYSAQPNTISGQQQQWSNAVYQQPYINPMYNATVQHPSTYPRLPPMVHA